MRKPRAIVCDDDHQILDLFRSIMEMMGYEVLTAETPITCAFYRDHADSCPQHDRCADVLITDYSMPNMTGLELLLMQQQGGCKLTGQNKALMTGEVNPEIRKKAAALGCQFFSKPLVVSPLIAWLKECEKRFNLSEPLASELYQPQRKTSFTVKKPCTPRIDKP